MKKIFLTALFLNSVGYISSMDLAKTRAEKAKKISAHVTNLPQNQNQKALRARVFVDRDKIQNSQRICNCLLWGGLAITLGTLYGTKYLCDYLYGEQQLELA